MCIRDRYRNEFHNVPPRGGYGTLDLWQDSWTEEGSVTSPREALQIIDSAETEINEKLDEGYDVTSALSKLNEAKAAYDEGQYDSAKSDAEMALTLPVEPTPPEPQTNWTLIIGGIVILAAIVVYFFKIRKS